MTPEKFDQEHAAIRLRLLEQYEWLSGSDFIELVVAELMLKNIAISRLQRELQMCQDAVIVYKLTRPASEG